MTKSLFVLLLAAVVQGPAFGATIYNLKDLGSLGDYSEGGGITDDGYVTGTTKIGTDSHAFIWSEANGMTSIGTIGGTGNSRGNDIKRDQNGELNIVGESNTYPYRWKPSTGIVQLDTVPGAANGVSSTGDVVATRPVLGGTQRVVRYSPTNTATVPYPLTPMSSAGIDDANQFVGIFSSTTTGYISDGGSLFQSFPNFIPTDLNNAGLISGSVGTDAALYNFASNSTTIIGKLGTMGTTARALGVGVDGTAVGESFDANGGLGFIYTSSMGLQSLTDLLSPAYSDFTILAGIDVASNGWILVNAKNNLTGEIHAGVLFAVPEPNFVGTPVDAAAQAFSTVARAIKQNCQASDECEPQEVVAPIKPLQVTEASAEDVARVRSGLAGMLEAGKLSETEKALTERAIQVLDNK